MNIQHPGRELIYQLSSSNYTQLKSQLDVFTNCEKLFETYVKNIEAGDNFRYDFEQHTFVTTFMPNIQHSFLRAKQDHRIHQIHQLAKRLFPNDPEKAKKVAEFLLYKCLKGTDLQTEKDYIDKGCVGVRHLLSFIERVQEQKLLSPKAKLERRPQKLRGRIEKLEREVGRLERQFRQKMLRVEGLLTEQLIKDVERHQPFSQQGKTNKKKVLETLKALKTAFTAELAAVIDLDALNSAVNIFPEEIFVIIDAIRNCLDSFDAGKMLLNRKAVLEKIKQARLALEEIESPTPETVEETPRVEEPPPRRVPPERKKALPPPKTPRGFFSKLAHFFGSIGGSIRYLWNIFWH